MAINSIETAVKYSEELDKLFTQKSATGFFADNDFGKKFVGAKTVIVPDIDFQGLANYNRDTGFSRGAITVSNTAYTMQMDRARSLQIDREDMDETGIASLAGKILGEYVRTKVIPECDAYVLSKLSTIAADNGNIVKFDVENPYKSFCEIINNVRSVVGYDEELVAFVNSGVYAVLQNSTEISKLIVSSDFKQGDVNLSVKSINGVSLIPVVDERMKTEFNFKTSGVGGFEPYGNARDIYMLVCPKKAAHLVKKTENMRVFTPEQNVDADAYKFDYRIYYDVFVKMSEIDSIWASLSPDAFIEMCADRNNIVIGEGVTADTCVTTNAKSVTYQWFVGNTPNIKKATEIEGENGSSIEYYFDNPGVYYLFVKVTIDKIKTVVFDSGAITVTEG